MKKYLYILLILSNYTFSQNQFSSKIKSECEIMISAMKNSNYNKILDYTYPKIVEMGGGREKLSSLMKSTFDKMKSEGFVFENEIIEEPQNIFIAGKELHCIIPKKTIMKTPKGRIQATYYYLGISKNGGGKWYFIETHMLNDENIKLIFPNFNFDLKIPKNSKSTLIE
ncbi:MAG: hypothetical protein PHC28_11015 [Flavobacterium sp.]|uniref:hypothetical protein n=1 Tax=Flavobacterium sp. TaxID=239 RepID=UPI00261C1170|nr:hypothetical protein [Flavobacterium sp.]MDD5150985.1 hypothetical protein [Flavobacterium sp.]